MRNGESILFFSFLCVTWNNKHRNKKRVLCRYYSTTCLYCGYGRTIVCSEQRPTATHWYLAEASSKATWKAGMQIIIPLYCSVNYGQTQIIVNRISYRTHWCLWANYNHFRMNVCQQKTLSSLGGYEEAGVYYNKAIQVTPKYPAAYTHKVLALEKMGQYQQAVGCHDKATQINPHYAEGCYKHGN